MTNESILVDELNKTNKFGNKILASKVNKKINRGDYLSKDSKKEEKLDRKLYDIFLSIVDLDTRVRLVELDVNINTIAAKIENECGWLMAGRDGFVYNNLFPTHQSEEFDSNEPYIVSRNEKGYYNALSEEKELSPYHTVVSKQQDHFLVKYYDELCDLHTLLTEKENIMGGDYTLDAEKNKELAESISKYLGYKQKPKEKEKSKILKVETNK